MENYRALLGYEREIKGFSPTDQIEFLDDDEVRDCMTFKEYERLKEFWSGSYIFEFMRISREITPFNTVGHIGGVHHVATFVGKQLAGTDIPVDMALLSGAAAGHDIGKFGCSPQEARRIPYLHYYYTDELLRKERHADVSRTSRAIIRRGTWSSRIFRWSLCCLYTRISGSRAAGETGEEIVHFYTLEESFDVILGKLDNVDMAKNVTIREESTQSSRISRII